MVNVNSLLSSWFGLLFDYVASLDNYIIVGGVSFFGVLVAIGIFSIITHIFFVKIIGFGNTPPVESKETKHKIKVRGFE